MGKGIVIDHRDGGMGHHRGMDENIAWCFQGGLPAKKAKVPWNGFEACASQGWLGLQNGDS